MNPSNINLKLDRKEVINVLTTALANHTKELVAAEKEAAQYQKEFDKFSKNVVAVIKKSLLKVNDASRFKFEDGHVGCELEVILDMNDYTDLKLPTKPKYHESTNKVQYCKAKIKELENIIKLLKLSKDETINSKMYQNLTSYLID